MLKPYSQNTVRRRRVLTIQVMKIAGLWGEDDSIWQGNSSQISHKTRRLAKLILLPFLAISLASCNASYGQGQNPGAVVVQATSAVAEATATHAITPEPTAMPTATAEATAVPEGVYEFPESWAIENGFLELAKEVEPGISWTTAACQFYEEEVCITDIDLCPEGNVCTQYLWISPFSFWGTTVEEYVAESPGSLLGDEYLLKMLLLDGDVVEYQDYYPIFLTPDQWERFRCTLPSWSTLGPLGEDEWTAMGLMTDRIRERLYMDDFGLFGVQLYQDRTQAECGG